MANKLRLNRASNDSGRRRRRANGPTFLVTLQDDTSTAQQSRHLQKTLAKKKSDLKRGTLTGTCGATQTTQGRNQTDAKKKERENESADAAQWIQPTKGTSQGNDWVVYTLRW